MATDGNLPEDPEAGGSGGNGGGDGGGGHNHGHITDLSIETELQDSYLTYAMSVIVSRALPDARDGLKPSQRRILVAMNDLNLSPGAGRIKCAKISGDTSGNYHPHGESVIYPTLVRMAQEWNMRHLLIDKQGNFGSIAGLPPAAMRYTEARLSPVAAAMLEDLRLNTVDYLPTYDERGEEPTVLPSKFPCLLVNGSVGIAVGMRTSIPPHNLREVCDALVMIIDNPDATIDEIMTVLPGPDFPTGAIICGRAGIRRAYLTGRSNIVLRSKATIEYGAKGGGTITITEIPYEKTRDPLVEKIGQVMSDQIVTGIREIQDHSNLEEPVRIKIELKRDADPDVVLNQLYQFTPLQSTYSLIFLALVDGKPRTLNVKQILEEHIRHRMQVIRRRTQFLLSRARRRKHTVEGLLVALANIDEIIRIIRTSSTQADAKMRLMGVAAPADMLLRALGEQGFRIYQEENGVAEEYPLSAIQADEILKMRLGQLVNLEQARLEDEHRKLLEEITEYLRILSDDQNILNIIKDDLLELRRKHGDNRRTEISDEELGDFDLEDLITEETMVVTISHKGYIKRTPASAYRAQRRGGKGLKGAQAEGEDPIEHLFVASTHAYLMFFTNQGQVYWKKIYDLPQLARDTRGRALVNLLELRPDEKIADCRAVRDFDAPDHFLVMATRDGLVKKTKLSAYRRPMKKGIIAVKLREGDELVDVAVAVAGDELVLATAEGMAIRFSVNDVRAVGRNSSGVKGINLGKEDHVVGMVVADPDATLLTVCEKGYGKRTQFGPHAVTEDDSADDADTGDADTADSGDDESSATDEISSSARYRTQRRGGKGLRDIKTTKRNGKVIEIVRVDDNDEVIMMTAHGKLQRLAVNEINIIGRNTQGVRVMNIDDDDTLAAIVRVPHEDVSDAEVAEAEAATPSPSNRIASSADRDEADDVELDDDSGDDDSEENGDE
ncbi:DNA gyrase subunit A [Lignipirellula cremea]|uniref:DNA topoisomerase (ATP-hydrolyzing) n=1 Tax=Lignipirellula cremea TaxID=2528010 RepID=A0A518DM96_9BACT|nr:DNA gyrase subunit A [Lignipirellula cremea]QDU92942.1 DNA gyrase subunit A [Lignipirellula cremea]